MVKIFVRTTFVVALAVLAGGCAQKKANWEVPSQPEPKTDVSTEEQVRRDKVAKEAEKDAKEDGLEQEIRNTKETRAQRKERQEQAKEAELERIVYVPTQEEREILARAAEIEAKKATAAAQRAKEVGDSPSIRQARRERAKADKKTKGDAERRAKFLASSRLVGCEPDTVEIFPLDQRFDPFAIFPSMVRIRVVNTSSQPIDIETSFHGYGPLVRNLCPGGSLSLSFKLGSMEESQQVPLTAITMTPEGQVGTQERMFWLQKNGRNQNVRNETWNVVIYTR